MKNDVVPVQIRGILPANSSCALFVGNDEKVFVINVEPQMGAVIGMFLRDTPKERPLTHDLMQRVFKGFGITVERVVITELKNSTYFARVILQQNNEVARKIVEIDARPSDCLAIAAAQKRPIFVTQSLFEQVEDMTEYLDKINESARLPLFIFILNCEKLYFRHQRSPPRPQLAAQLRGEEIINRLKLFVRLVLNFNLVK